MKFLKPSNLLLLVFFIVVQANAFEITISGRVVYRTGSPAKAAKVVFWSYGATASIQPMTQSGEDGAFSINIPDQSYGAISASKLEEGYPDAVLAFYGRSGYESLQVVDLRADLANQPVQLQFGTPQRTISWLVVDSKTGKSVRGGRAELQTADNPEITGSETIREGEPFLFVLPRNPIRIRITAKGYTDQSFIESDKTPESYDGPVVMDQRVIRLQPAR